MKSKVLLFCTLLSAGLGLYSCDTETTGDSSNYWTRNALTHLKLRGAVKTLTQTERVYNFNTEGNLSSQVVYGNETFYHYEDGKMVRSVSYYSGSEIGDTIRYEYDNVGKFIPRSTFHLFETGLVPALSAVITSQGRTDYDFHGSNLWIVYSINMGNDLRAMDTAVVAFTGNYPSSYTGVFEFMNNMTYAANGMFRTYSEGFLYPESSSTRAYSFLSNDDYLLMSSRVETSTGSYNNGTSTTSYTYNSHFDVLKETYVSSYMNGDEQSSYQSETEYSDYVYDSNGNWTSRKMRSKNQDVWSAYQTETRGFEYY